MRSPSALVSILFYCSIHCTYISNFVVVIFDRLACLIYVKRKLRDMMRIIAAGSQITVLNQASNHAHPQVLADSEEPF